MVHVGAPDVATGLASQGVIDGTEQDRGAEGQQQVEHAMPQLIQVPTSVAEEAVKGAVVLELGELSALNDAGQGATAGTQDPGTDQPPEGAEARLGKAGLEGLEERSKGPYQQIGHGVTSLSSIFMKDKEAKKKKRLPPLPFFQQLPIDLPDLPKQVLNFREAAESVFHLALQLLGDGDLANTALTLAHRQDPDGTMSLPLSLFGSGGSWACCSAPEKSDCEVTRSRLV